VLLLLLAYLLSWFQVVVEVEELEKVSSIERGGFYYLTRYDFFLLSGATSLYSFSPGGLRELIDCKKGLNN
jgi:hypothetical protein